MSWRLLIFLFVFCPVLAGAQMVDEVPRETAAAWLALVDTAKYGESWKSASPFFQKAISEENWIKNIRQSRDSLGALKQRNFVRARFMRDPAGMPKGEYFAMEFESQFEKKKIMELVVPMRDETGLWQVSSYSISDSAPKPQP